MESKQDMGQTSRRSLATSISNQSFRFSKRKNLIHFNPFFIYLSILETQKKDQSNDIQVSLDSELCMDEAGKVVGTQVPTDNILLLNARLETSPTGLSLSTREFFLFMFFFS